MARDNYDETKGKNVYPQSPSVKAKKKKKNNNNGTEAKSTPQSSSNASNPRAQTGYYNQARRKARNNSPQQTQPQTPQRTSTYRGVNRRTTANTAAEMQRQREEAANKSIQRTREARFAREQQSQKPSGVQAAIRDRQDPLGVNQQRQKSFQERYNKENPQTAEEARKVKEREERNKSRIMDTKAAPSYYGASLKQAETDREKMQETAIGRIVSNAPERVIEDEKKYFTNIGIAAADVGEMLNGPGRNKNGRLAQDMEGLLPDSNEMKGKFSQSKRRLIEKRDEYEAEAAARNEGAGRLEKNFYSAEESGAGMLTDQILGFVTAPVGGWRVPLFLRSYGGSLGKAEELGATTTEDRLNAAKDGIIEVATESIGGFFGRSRGGKFAKEGAGRFVGRNFKSAFKKFLRVGAEEHLEEVIANPLEHLGENLIFRNRLQAEREAQNDDYFNEIAQSIQEEFANDPTSVQRYIAEVNSPDTRESFVKDFKEGGMTDEQAGAVADKMIEFMVAAAQNDTDKMKAIKDSLDEDLVGDMSMKVWDWNEQLDLALSTWMVSGVGGANVAYTSYQQGQAIKSMPNANQRMEHALEKVAAFDPDNASKSKAMLDAMRNEGYEPTATQAYDIMAEERQVMSKVRDNQVTANQVKQNGVKRERLTVPVAEYDDTGEYRVTGKVSTERYAQKYVDTLEMIQAYDDSSYEMQTSREEAMSIAEAIASFEIGTLSVAETARLTLDNPENRYMFKEMTGIDLDEYNVKGKNGEIDPVASNLNMQKGLLALAADRYIESARIEQFNWNDEERGRLADEAGKGLDPQGDLALHDALDSVDPRDYQQFMLMGRVAQDLYSHAYYTQDSWEDVKRTYEKLYPSLNIGTLQGMYDSAKADREAAETPYLNAEVEAGEKLGKVKSGKKKGQARGRFINEDPFNEETGEGRDLKGSELAAIKQMAQNFNVDIIQVDKDNLKLRIKYKGENGRTRFRKDSKGDTVKANASVDFRNHVIYISSAAPIEKVLHEIVHQTARLAAPQYIDMAHHILNAAYKYDATETRAMIEDYKQRYRDQDLTDAQIEEEVVADLVATYMNDPKFVRAIANENLTALQKIKNAIDDVIRAIRNFISSGHITDENQRNSLLNTLGIYTDVRDMMVRVYREAANAKAAEAINQKQDEVNVASQATLGQETPNIMSSGEIRLSLTENFPEYNRDKTNLDIAVDALSSVFDQQISWVDFLEGEQDGEERGEEKPKRQVPIGQLTWDDIAWTEEAAEESSEGSETEQISSMRRNKENNSGIRTVGRRIPIAEELVRKGYIDLRGHKVAKPEDLAKLCQVLRNPMFETSRIFYLKGDTIVGHRAVSSRLPMESKGTYSKGTTYWSEEAKYQKDVMRRLGADGYYVMHNHPSGHVTASSADKAFTKMFQKSVPGMKGHIILDHNKFGWITPGGTASEKTISGTNFWEDPLHVPSIENEHLGFEWSGKPEELAAIGRDIVQEKDGYSVVVYMTSYLEINEIQEINNKVILNDKNFANYIKNENARAGSGRAVIYTTDPKVKKFSEGLVRTKHFEGVVYEDKSALTVSRKPVIVFSGGKDISAWGKTIPQKKAYANGGVKYDSAKTWYQESKVRFSISPEQDKDYMDTAEEFQKLYEADDPGWFKLQHKLYKMVDEAAIANGYNIKAYHGTDSEPFNVFDRNKLRHGRQYGDGFYFSPYEDYASLYGQDVREYYLKGNGMELGERFAAQDYKDFDNREDAHRFFEEKLKQFEENGQGIERFRPDASMENGKYRVTYTTIGSFQNNVILVATEPEYIKSADPITYDDEGNIIPLSERFNEESPDIRFSLSEPVERVKDLIAVHNLSPSKLRGVFRLGGFPMPSIAVTNQSHENFGEISLLFGSDTIDPKKDKANKVYSADAWTPTVPETEYEADYKKVSNIYHKIKDVVGDNPYLNHGISADFHYENVQESLKRNGGFDGFIDRMMDKPYMKYAYLKENGKEVEIPYKEGQLQGHGQDVWKKIDAAIPEMTASEAYNMSREEAMKYDPVIREILQNDFKERIGEERAEKLKDNLPYSTEFPWGKVSNYLASLVAFRNAGGVIEETDSAAFEKAMNDQIDKAEFRTWLNNLFNGVIKSEGVRNNKDPFTAMGERRSFKSLHYPVTVDGILRAMKEQGEKNVSNYTTVKTLRADTAKSFKSLDEIRKDKGKLQNLDQEHVDAIYQELDDKFYSIINSIGDKSSSKAYDICAADAIADTISECAQLGYTQPEQIIRKFKEYQYTVTLADAEDILQLLDAIQNMPVNMFEAKPRRAVGFDEVKAAIIPSDIEADIRSELELMEIPVYEYEANNEDARQEAVNEAATEQDVRFSLAQKYDEDYMAAVESGDMETAAKLVETAAKEAGYDTRVYHGTPNGGRFNVFDAKKLSNTKMSSHIGQGFYFTNSREGAEEYTSNFDVYGNVSKGKSPYLYEGYLKLQDPIEVTENSHTLTYAQIRAIIADGNNVWFFDHGIAHILQNKDINGRAFSKDEILGMDRDKRIDLYSEYLSRYGDMAALSNMVDAYTFDRQEDLLIAMRKHTGCDGVHWQVREGLDQFVAFEPSQFKESEAVTYADDGSVIPLSQRFDPYNDDIRYSLPTQDSKGKVLSDGQMEYFKNSQARDEQGRLVPVYHTTNRGGFTVFDPEEADDHRSLFFSDSFEVSQTYGDYGSDSQFDTESYAAVAANKAAIEEMKEDSQAIVRRIKIKGIGSKEIDGETSGTGYEIFVDAEVKGENGEWHTIKEKRTINIDSDLIENADSVDDLDAAMEDLHGEAMYTAADMLGVDVEYLWDVYEIGSGWGFDMDYTPEEGIDAVDTDGSRADLEEYGYDSSAYRGYYAVYLNLANPLVVEGNRNNWNDLSNPALGIIDREWEMFTDDSGRQVVTYTDDGGEAVEISDEEAERLLGWDLYDKLATRWFESDYGSVKTKWDTANNMLGRRSKTRDIAEYAYENGHDGVIIRNIADVNKRTANPFSDIYIAFSSAQVKDINNTNPTDNPDIRYSLPEDDEAMSHEAHNDAYDDSWEALVYYEEVIERMKDEDLDDDGFINHPMQVYLERLRKYGETDEKARRGRDKSKYRETKFKSEEDWTEAFYAGLTWQASEMRFDDPVLEEGRTRMASSRDDFFNSAVAKWNQTWVTEGAVLDINSIRKPVRDLVMAVMQQSDTNRKYKSDTVKKTLIDLRLAFWYAQKGRIEIADALIWHSAMRMIQDVEFYDDSLYEEYKDLRHYMRTTRIQLGPEYWSDVEYQTFRKANYGRMKLVSGPTNVDQVYQELEELFPGLFNSEEYTTAPDQLVHMADVLESIQPYKIAYSSEECAALATEISYDLQDILLQGKAIESVADKYEAKIKAMKTRHAEAMLKVREQRDNAVKAEKAKFKEYKEKQKERGLHRKHFQSIQKTHKALSDRLLSNTADKNIPEQYKKELAKVLAAFDLQTVGSKKREAETGHVSQKKIRMGALIAALSNIEAKSGEFHVNDAITDIIDELLGKDVGNGFNRSIEGLTIDELNSGELARIDKLLKALLHEFNTYQSVKIKAKRQQVADIGKAQVDHAFEYAEQFGSRKDYNSVIGILDKIVNLDEMTAAYMFRQIDPNNEGLGLMFRELRLGFDHYVRNTEQLNEWMGEILGNYQNRGKFGPGKYGADQIDEWRSSNYARTFNLENGSVSLTPAQMMSVYCLARRIQAYNHMTGAGIVVAPVYYDASLMSDIKQKVNTAKPVKLTEADIKQIVGQLTPEQREVADKLQQLMANQMAAWGNEASMNVLGIELFHEPDYFPIRSDKGGLTKDLDENQFVEAIRSFGFTKAVTPGARNAIMVDDIFSVVAEHCNNMNLYNSYSEAINDFMKVYNYRDVDERWGENTVAQAVAHAFSQKANTFIMQFIRDLNGNVSGNNTGIAKMYNDLLSKAKKASVFANGRVALQQPTAIARAFYLINPKYLKGIRIGKGDMREMFEHCPIALWKSWGYYDIQMGRSIEDVMMNNGNWLEDIETGLYGRLDNMTWTAIWQMVKAEMKDTHPEVEEGTDEYWELCNERMTEIVDLTQVVDSPMHRSHAMRSKDYLEKTATAFMSEPTLTFNMVKDGVLRAREALKSGNKAEAGSIFAKTMGVFLLQAALVSAMAALWDAVRKRNPNGDDDEDPSFFALWWLNTLHNFVDEIEIWNKVYFVKDISSLFQGYGLNNMALQGWKSIADGIAQLTGSRNVYSSKEWYENLLNGFGYVTGKPYGTLLKDMKAIYNWAGLDWKAVNLVGGYLDDTKERFNDMFGKDDKETVASSFMAILDGKKNSDTYEEDELYEGSVPSEDDLPDNLTEEQKKDIIKSANKRSKKAAEKEEAGQLDYDEMLYKALKSASGLEGEEYNKKVYSSVANGLKGYIAEGDYQSIGMMRTVIEQAGGDVDYFDQRVLDETKTAFKKSMGYDLSQEGRWSMKSQWRYLVGHGMTAEEISSEIIYKSDLAKDMKVAYRLGDNGTIYEAMLPLVDAGLTEADMNRLYENRNRMDLSKYNGRYKDKLKSTGNFIWPTQGTITSGFGRRSAPTRGASSFHQGIDIGAAQGTPVVACDGGVVITAGSNGGYGNSVGIKHDDGTISYYNHLYAWNVKVGDSVGQGQQIGQVGSTGISTGPHLDFRLYKNGEYLNPLEYLDKRS